MEKNLQNRQTLMNRLASVIYKVEISVKQNPPFPSSHQIVKLAVYGMLPRNLHRRTMMQRLHLFPEDVSREPLHLPQLVTWLKIHYAHFCGNV